MSDKPTGLELLRKPFPAHQISKLPKPTKQQTEEVKNDFSKGIRCGICGAWHHPKVVHLDYVGHAALTDRLLDADPNWSWEPVAFNDGLPAVDRIGGLWIRLTVCGVSRLGYGHAADKTGGDAVKEIIGDALRNAAMRFGAALDLWHKGDLHIESEQERPAEPTAEELRKIKHDESLAVWQESVDAIKTAIAKDDAYTVRELWAEIHDAAKIALWIAPSKGGCFSTAEREYIKTMKAVEVES